MSKAVVKHNEDYLVNRLTSKIKLANRLILEDIHRESRFKTPMSKGLPTDGDLREQVSKTVEDLSGIIEWKVPYAQYQERGKRRDGSYVVKRYTTPGTGKEFAKNAVQKVLNEKTLRKYFVNGGL